jgi:heme exporter protein C
MREKTLYLLGVFAVALMAYNLTEIAARPLQALFYIPLCGTAALAAVASLAASIAFLRTRNFRFDSLAVAATEAGLAFLAAGIVNACFLIHAAAGKWWTWDSRLTAALVCWLLYATYLMLRHAVHEPTQRAASTAVWSVFAFLDVPLAVVTIQWWKPAAHLRFDWTQLRFCNLAALVLLGTLFTVVRMRQEETRREMDSLRRMTHAL